jgi:hypothetical protein
MQLATVPTFGFVQGSPPFGALDGAPYGAPVNAKIKS